jgi:protein-disulfide isomerase
MMLLMRSATSTVALLVLLACTTPAQQQASGQTGSDVAARIGDRTITIQELDARWQETEPAARAQAVQQIYDGRKQALDGIIADMLLEEAANAQGTTPELYAQGEIARRMRAVTDAEVTAFFQENQEQMQGRGLAAMGPVIRRYLDEQQREAARLALLAELRAAGPPLRLVLDAPRYDVPVAPDDPVLGSADAPVTLVEFSDFQCPFCARVMPTLKRVRETYGDRVRIVWKDFPLTSIHPQAFKAAEAGQCAREQGKFWEYHDLLFANQQSLEPEFLKKYAADTGLDVAAFNACLDTAKYGDRVQEQMGMGNRLGVSSTPSSFINGRLVSGAQPYEAFAAIIDEELARAQEP